MSLKLRTESLILDHLDKEMAWRIKEIAEFKSSVDNAQGQNVNAHIRAGVSMLYAHWEGFIKSAANAYVNYVSCRADWNSALQPCFVALGMKTMLSASAASSKSGLAVEVITHMADHLNKPVRLPREGAISAESNLSSTVFLNIVGWIGIDATQYAARFPLIDKSLLEARNNIAHGNFLTITSDGFHNLTIEILEMLRWFKTDIENAVVEKKFLKQPLVA